MSHDPVIIRQGTLADIDTLVQLLEDLFSIEADFQPNAARQKKGLSMMLADDTGERILFVAETNGKVIGMCSAQTLISTAEGGPAAVIEDMVVQAPWRGKGIGPRLLREIEAWTKKKGIRRLQLLADKNNSQALEFYHKQNWQKTRLICLRKYVSP